MIFYKRLINSFILTTIVIMLGSIIDGFVDMGLENVLVSPYFIGTVLLASYVIEPLITKYFTK